MLSRGGFFVVVIFSTSVTRKKDESVFVLIIFSFGALLQNILIMTIHAINFCARNPEKPEVTLVSANNRFVARIFKVVVLLTSIIEINQSYFLSIPNQSANLRRVFFFFLRRSRSNRKIPRSFSTRKERTALAACTKMSVFCRVVDL